MCRRWMDFFPLSGERGRGEEAWSGGEWKRERKGGRGKERGGGGEGREGDCTWKWVGEGRGRGGVGEGRGGEIQKIEGISL